ncbi:MAG: hypothetical protein ACON4R_08005 [Akkermansiaceae bacterium]
MLLTSSDDFRFFVAKAFRLATRISKWEHMAMGERECAWMRESFGWPRIGVRMKEWYERLLVTRQA